MRQICKITDSMAVSFFLLSFFLMIFAAPIHMGAAQAGNVYDDAGLLTGEEMQSLNEEIASFMAESGWNIYAVTTEDARGKTAEAYADDFFDSHSPEKEDGAVLFIDMDNREFTISTCGIAIRYLTDERIDRILDDAYGYISDGDYEGCFQAMLLGIQEVYQEGIPENQYNYDEETGTISPYHHITLTEGLFAAVLAVAAGCIVFFGIVGKYRLKFGVYQYDPHKFGSIHLNRSEDNFIHQTVTQHKIQSSSGSSGHSSGGQSSTHHSSSGRSHGGGSRKF